MLVVPVTPPGTSAAGAVAPVATPAAARSYAQELDAADQAIKAALQQIDQQPDNLVLVKETVLMLVERARLSGLPGDYAAPRGALVLAWVDGSVAGCCALRPLDTVDYANAAEMKRLFVRKPFRRFGLGRLLVDAILDAARQAGYDRVLLDTLDDMEAARSLYATLGFEEIPPYYHNPIVGAVFLGRKLAPSPDGA